MNTVIAALTGVPPAIDRIGIAAQQVSPIFTQWGTVAQQAGQGVQQAGQEAQQAAVMFTQWGTVAQQAGAAAAQAGQQGAIAGQTAAAGAQQATSAWDVLLAKLREVLGLAGQASATSGAGGAGFAGGGFVGGRGSGTSDSNLAWVSRGEYIMPAGAVRQPGVLSFLEALRRSGKISGFAQGGLVGGGGTETIRLSVDNLLQALEKNTEAIDSQSNVIISLGQVVDRLVQTVGGLVQQQGQLVQSFNDLMGWAKSSAPQEKARGGLLGGRGTGTSDSNLAWVSRGEHIMPAHVVRQPGMLAFLEALRRSGGNLSRVLDGMGRFALGGMAPRAMPAFATGGLVGAQNRNLGTLTLALPDGTTISGLTDERIAAALGRMAVKGRVRSGGRKPSRYT